MRQALNKSKHKGFTLFELLTSLAIILILSGLASGSYKFVKSSNYRGAMQLFLSRVSVELHQHQLANQTYTSYSLPTENLPEGYDYYDLHTDFSDESFELYASPKGFQAGDGVLWINSSGETRHYAGDSPQGDFERW